jgi:hypothetical protein
VKGGFTAQQERDIASALQYTLKAEERRVPAQSAVAMMQAIGKGVPQN